MFTCCLFYFCDTISQLRYITLNSCDIALNIRDVTFYFRYAIVGRFELTTVHCIRRSIRNFSSSYTANFSVSINSYFIIDSNGAFFIQLHRRFIIGNSISSDIYIG